MKINLKQKYFLGEIIKPHCFQVSELKRINSIHKDNEIYARKIIKVPSNPLSLLLEKEYFSKSDNNEAATGPASVESASQPCQSNYDSIVETVNSSNFNPRTSDVIAQEEECDGSCASKSEKESPDESVFLLGAVAEEKRSDVMSCNGADWGISWHMLILITLLLGVGGPVLYVFWFLWGKSHKDEGS